MVCMEGQFPRPEDTERSRLGIIADRERLHAPLVAESGGGVGGTLTPDYGVLFPSNPTLPYHDKPVGRDYGRNIPGVPILSQDILQSLGLNEDFRHRLREPNAYTPSGLSSIVGSSNYKFH